MKISIFSLPELALGKHNLKDSRLDQVYKIAQSKKETYIQLELVSADSASDADVILAAKEACADLILGDMEFIETRLSRTEDASEKILLNKLKSILEKEEFIFNASLNEEEKKAMSPYSLFTNRPVSVAQKEDLDNLDILLLKCLGEGGFISFFTAGEKETRAWLIRKGSTAWEAAGAIHSDIQKGFIRAEIIAFSDFIACGGETQAKQAGKLRLEQKDYLMQDTDLANFRFNR